MRASRLLPLLAACVLLLAVGAAATSSCAPSHTQCASHAGSATAVCCPSDTHVCQATTFAAKCVSKAAVSACNDCCSTGACSGVQCCGTKHSQSYCCASGSAATADGGVMVPAQRAEQCMAGPESFDCIEAPSSIMHVAVQLAAWQIALCAVGGFLCCGALTGGGHRAHGGHCSNDCQGQHEQQKRSNRAGDVLCKMLTDHACCVLPVYSVDCVLRWMRSVRMLQRQGRRWSAIARVSKSQAAELFSTVAAECLIISSPLSAFTYRSDLTPPLV